MMYIWLGLSVFSILSVTISSLWIEMMNFYQLPLDWFTMICCIWNFAVVGLVAVFWESPLWLQQSYLILISSATAISLLRLPPWTTWTVLIAVAIYVLCPGGPLKLLLELAAERDEEIPALIYTAGMADIDDGGGLMIGYRTEDNTKPSKSRFGWFGSRRNGYERLEVEEDNSFCEPGNHTSTSANESQVEEDTEGLGDFIFYSVLVGKAADTDAITLCMCIFAVLTVSDEYKRYCAEFYIRDFRLQF
ncbi:Presenilin-2 [Apophysomyces sp. BC1015]|nr:Presenilin-2 [Apophysomyces sp. BC1015]